MSVAMLLAASGGGAPPVSKTFTYKSTAQTFTVPAGVTNLAIVSGQGGRGSPAGSDYIQQYSKDTATVVTHNDQGGNRTSTHTYSTGSGPTPANYCDAEQNYPSSSGSIIINSSQTCYYFTNTSYYQSYSATTGANTTGFGQTFPGGVGKAATPVSFNNVAVVPGQVYSIMVPSGGSLTISYYV